MDTAATALNAWSAFKHFQNASHMMNPNYAEQTPSNLQVSRSDIGVTQAGGREFLIFQTQATGDTQSTNIANFRTYIGGPSLKGYTWLCLEYVEIFNGFGATLHALGLHMENFVNPVTIGNSSSQNGATVGNMPGSFIVTFESGALPVSNVGIWRPQYAKQKCIPIVNFNSDYLDICLFNELGELLQWDGTTSVYLTLIFKAY